MPEIDMNKSNAEILAILLADFRKNHSENSNMSDEQILGFFKKVNPWMECPIEKGRVQPMQCMFCSYGHMVECHYPLSCDEAQCSHSGGYDFTEGYD